MNQINELRSKIDNIDENIVRLIIDRQNNAKGIIKNKKDLGISFEDKTRESEILNSLRLKFANQIDFHLIQEIFIKLFNNSKKSISNQNKLMEVTDIMTASNVIISGPCAVETEEQIDEIAKQLVNKNIKYLRAGAYKPRTSPNTFQGLGKEGIEIARRVADKYNLFLVAEILEIEQLIENYDSIDIVQIGSRNMASFGLLKSVGKFTSNDKKPILLKRGFSATLKELTNAGKYIEQEGNENVIYCLRGIRTFEQIDSKLRNTPDLASILELKNLTDKPVFFDPSHSTGDFKYVVDIAKAALTLGADGLLIETHTNPTKSWVDAEQSISVEELNSILDFINILKESN